MLLELLNSVSAPFSCWKQQCSMMLSLLGCSSGVDATTSWYIVLKNHLSQLTEISVAMSIQIGAFAQAV